MKLRDKNGKFLKGSSPGPGRPKGTTKYRHRSDSDVAHLKARSAARLGLSLDDYDQLYAQQNGKCAICNLPESKILHGRVTNLSLDHCHLTGKVRGLLCYSCNTGIGKLKDDPNLLVAAAIYLESYQ